MDEKDKKSLVSDESDDEEMQSIRNRYQRRSPQKVILSGDEEKYENDQYATVHHKNSMREEPEESQEENDQDVQHTSSQLQSTHLEDNDGDGGL